MSDGECLGTHLGIVIFIVDALDVGIEVALPRKANVASVDLCS